ncbi:MAG TPA: dopamine receptor D4 [Mycobacterium sp.]|nr:dopamine receptor D4 [Mycobacterium sp.]
MNIAPRTTAKIAGAGVAALATAVICSPNALGDPPTPVPPPPAPDTSNQAGPALPDGVPHLSSPDNPPPGTSDDPVPGAESDGQAYAHEIWQAIQNHDITWRQGLVLLAQRPMNPTAAPPPGLSAGPQQPGPQQPAPGAPPQPPSPSPSP